MGLLLLCQPTMGRNNSYWQTSIPHINENKQKKKKTYEKDFPCTQYSAAFQCQIMIFNFTQVKLNRVHTSKAYPFLATFVGLCSLPQASDVMSTSTCCTFGVRCSSLVSFSAYLTFFLPFLCLSSDATFSPRLMCL